MVRDSTISSCLILKVYRKAVDLDKISARMTVKWFKFLFFKIERLLFHVDGFPRSSIDLQIQLEITVVWFYVDKFNSALVLFG